VPQWLAILKTKEHSTADWPKMQEHFSAGASMARYLEKRRSIPAGAIFRPPVRPLARRTIGYARRQH